MPIYEYKALDTGGGSKSGIVDADTPREARNKLRAEGVHVVEIHAIEERKADAAMLTLAPLFERYDPATVAAAVFELWTTASASPATPAEPEATATARIYVGVGKKDGATVNDIVAVLTKEVRVDRGKIGRVELRDSYSLVELPAQEAERIAQALSGATIRRKRVTARVDRGPAKPARSTRPPQRRG